jgi:hypothetical protein
MPGEGSSLTTGLSSPSVGSSSLCTTSDCTLSANGGSISCSTVERRLCCHTTVLGVLKAFGDYSLGSIAQCRVGPKELPSANEKGRLITAETMHHIQDGAIACSLARSYNRARQMSKGSKKTAMKIKATCGVDSLTLLREKVEFEWNGKIYSFIPNENNYLSEIQLISNVDSPEQFNSTFAKAKPEDKQQTLTIKQDAEQMSAIRAEFQELESLLALTHNVKRIHWDALHYKLLFDTPEERKITGVTGFKLTWDYPDLPKLATPEHLYAAVATKERMASLTVPLAFWREAHKDFTQHRYINAFYNFYFILEGLYGGGQWRNQEVAKEFKNSELTKYIDYFLNTAMARAGDKFLQPRLEEMINDMNLSNAARKGYVKQALDIDGIIALIINTRGSLLRIPLKAATHSGVSGHP